MDVRRSVADPAFDAQVNLVGFLNLMEAGRENGFAAWCFPRPAARFTASRNLSRADENHPLRPVSPYGVAKLATEKYLFFYHAQYGIDYVAMRYANVYGPRQDPHGEAGVVAIFCGRILEDRPVTIYGDGGQTRDYVFVGDVVRANMAAVAATVSGAFNIGTGVETDVNQLYADTRPSIAGTAARPSSVRRARANSGARLSAARRGRPTSWDGARRWSCPTAWRRPCAFFRDRAAR